MSKKIKVGIIFGGRSAEHEVSLQSAKNIIEAINRDKYDVVLIGIDKEGRWYLNDETKYLLHANNPKLIKLNNSPEELSLIPGGKNNNFYNISKREIIKNIDVVFPVLHGTFGEDGTIQGMLKLADMPFVGAGVLGSAVGMDKDVMKRLWRDAKIPIADFLVFDHTTKKNCGFKLIQDKLGMPVFVKPANLGSSVGISKVKTADELDRAVNLAFQYDNKIIIEENIIGREIECSVLGNEDPVASVPGEIIPHHEFYSYEAKYIDGKGSSLEIPAKLDRNIIKKAQSLAVEAYKSLCCEGMARVDFFLRGRDEVIVNEINTIPGFTRISMYPKLWEASGISYSDLIDRLIQLALERFERDERLKTTFE